MAILNNLYPGVVSTYAPAFLLDSGNDVKDTCRVYFSLSAYNSRSDITNIQVTVANQFNNLSVLDTTKYPCGIMLKPLQVDNTRLSDDKYYFEIKKADIQGGTFEINQYYKVQFRFTGVDAQSVSMTTPQAIDSWLANNISHFSEWSTVCLIRAISTPTLTLVGFDPTADSTLWSTSNVDVVGRLTFKNPAETDTLSQYQIRLYDYADNVVVDTGILYTNNYNSINEINYTLNKYFKDGETYTLKVDYQTRNLYSDSVEFNFTIIETGGEVLDATLSVIEDVDNGRIGINIKGNTTDKFTGNITIRRTSSVSNFEIWEDVYTTSVEDKILDFTWYDCTIESGVWYRYAAQRRDGLGNRGLINKLAGEYMIEFEDDLFLTADDTQIKIKFNPNISSFKYNVAEGQVNTIGGKYPIIKRNGAQYYRSFPITGTITHFMDKDHLFTSRDKIWNEEVLALYDAYNDENRITPINDRTYEREFRELVMEFLYKHNVKLFRSATEGNILVKLMDINFSPEIPLGRQIYNFSCNAVEVDECDIDTCDYYGIQSKGALDTFLAYTNEYTGALDEIIPANTDVIEYLNSKYQKYAVEKYVAAIDYLDFLRLEFEDKPYLIKEGADGAYPIDDTGSDRDESPAAASYLGYIAKINGNIVVINPEGIYELKGENVRITSLSFPVDTRVRLDYHLSLSQSEDPAQQMKKIDYFNKVGQVWGAFKPDTSVYRRIWNKYFEKYNDWTQTLLSLNGATVTAEPGTVIYVKESGEEGFDRHVIGQTNSLTFDDSESVIEGLYFAGKHFEEATEEEAQRDILPENKYVDTGISAHFVEDIEDPILGGVYTIYDAVLPVYPWEKNDELYIKQPNTELSNDTIQMNHNRFHSVRTGVLTMLLNRVVVLIDDDTVVTDPEHIEYIQELRKRGYKVVTIGSDEEKGLIYVLQDKVSQNADGSYSLTYNRNVDEEYALILDEELDASQKYIYYQGGWYPFTDNHDIICNIEAVIDYHCELMKGYFNI